MPEEIRKKSCPGIYMISKEVEGGDYGVHQTYVAAHSHDDAMDVYRKERPWDERAIYRVAMLIKNVCKLEPSVIDACIYIE